MSSDEKLHLSNVWRFRDAGRTFLVNTETLALFETDDLTEAVLDRSDRPLGEIEAELGPVYGLDAVRSAISVLGTCGFQRVQDWQQPGPVSPISLSVNVIQECNLACVYCYGGQGEYRDRGKMSPETAEAAVDFLLSQLPGGKTGTLTFFGGEPLLNFSLVKHVIAYAQDRTRSTGKAIHFSMTTNGSLLTEQRRRYLREHSVFIQVSMDGDADAQNTNRPFRNHTGSSNDHVLKMVRPLLVEKPTSARGTVTRTNLALKHHADALLTAGFAQVFLVPVDGAPELFDERDDAEFIREYLELIGWAKEQVAAGLVHKLKPYGNLMHDLLKVHSGGRRQSVCGAGRQMLAVDIRGNLYPCHRFVGEPRFVVGNVFDGLHKNPGQYSTEQYQSETHVRGMGECHTCHARAFCVGGCSHTNYVETGKTDTHAIRQCHQVKAVFADILSLYAMIPFEGRAKLFGKSRVPEWALGRSTFEILSHKEAL